MRLLSCGQSPFVPSSHREALADHQLAADVKRLPRSGTFSAPPEEWNPPLLVEPRARSLSLRHLSSVHETFATAARTAGERGATSTRDRRILPFTIG